MTDQWKDLASKYDALQVSAPQEQAATAAPSAPATPQKIGAEAFPDAVREVLANADWFTKKAAAFGSGVRGMYEGARQIGNAESKSNIEANKLIAQESPISAFIGNVAPAAITSAIPGANTYLGAAAIGGITGLLQPTEGDESRLTNTAVGVAGGVGGQYAAGKIADIVRRKAADAGTKALADNSAREPLRITLKDGQDLGLVVPPSSVNPSPTNRAIEAVSGKYATANEASLRNQEVVNSTVRKALGLPEGTPLTENTLEAFRAAQSAPYQAVAALGDMPLLGYNPGSLGPAVSGNKAPSFMNLQQKTIPGAGTINAKEAVEKLKELRFAAKEQWKFYGRQGDPQARVKAEAFQTAADNLENWLEKAAATAGKPDLVNQLRAARVAIAKSHDVERAITDATGNVSAKDLAKSKYLSGDLKKIAQFAEAFPAAVKTPESIGSPVTLVNAALSGALGVGGAAATGSPIGALLPAARPLARSVILSRPYQSTMAQVPNASVPRTLRLADILAQSRLAQGAVPGLAAHGVLGSVPMFE